MLSPAGQKKYAIAFIAIKALECNLEFEKKHLVPLLIQVYANINTLLIVYAKAF